jgi:hypothetical protein
MIVTQYFWTETFRINNLALGLHLNNIQYGSTVVVMGKSTVAPMRPT